MGHTPATRPLTVAARIGPDLRAAMDAWRAAQPDPKPTRAEAVKVALSTWLTDGGYFAPEAGLTSPGPSGAESPADTRPGA